MLSLNLSRGTALPIINTTIRNTFLNISVREVGNLTYIYIYIWDINFANMQLSNIFTTATLVAAISATYGTVYSP